jgi:peroxiredoxin
VTLPVGAWAPPFEADAVDGQQLRLESLIQGGGLVLSFVPSLLAPLGAALLRGLGAVTPQLQLQGIGALCISGDPVAELRAAVAGETRGVQLVSDRAGRIGTLYDVLGAPAALAGRLLEGADGAFAPLVRGSAPSTGPLPSLTTYLINPRRRIVGLCDSPLFPRKHADLVRAAVGLPPSVR